MEKNLMGKLAGRLPAFQTQLMLFCSAAVQW